MHALLGGRRRRALREGQVGEPAARDEADAGGHGGRRVGRRVEEVGGEADAEEAVAEHGERGGEGGGGAQQREEGALARLRRTAEGIA